MLFINNIIGRLPSFVTRNKILFNIGTFVGFFSMGVNSYKKICFDKIMKLEDSKLADQVREHMKRFVMIFTNHLLFSLIY